jgi:hypothetical protein
MEVVMALSDLFRKIPKKKQVAVHNHSSSVPDHVQRARQAALEFLAILEVKLAASDASLQAGSMLSAAAWLTGTSLYRSFNFKDDSAPGTMIKANEVNTTWESLMYQLEHYNFHRADIPVGRLIMAGMGASDFYTPQVEMFQVQKELQDKYNAVMKKHGFGYLDGARAGIVLCSLLIQQYHAARVLDPETAAGIVAERVLEAARTVPPSLSR